MKTLMMSMAIGLAAVGSVLVTGDWAEAQSQGVTASGSAVYNPYANPYVNPYLNPAMTMTNTTRSDALIYLWAAQQQPGALLAPRGAASRTAPPAAEMHRGALTATGGAGRYFGRGSDGAVPGTGHRYQRFNRYYSSNGR